MAVVSNTVQELVIKLYMFLIVIKTKDITWYSFWIDSFPFGNCFLCFRQFGAARQNASPTA